MPTDADHADVTAAVAAVQQADVDLGTNLHETEVLGLLKPHIRAHTIQPMVDAMSETLRRVLLAKARLQFVAFEAMIESDRKRGRDPSSTIALREWLYRQPFVPVTRRGLPTVEESYTDEIDTTFRRLLPHIRPGNIDAVLESLTPAFRRRLRDLAAGMRPGLDIILETARQHGHDTAPWHALMDWEASLPPLPDPVRVVDVPRALAAVKRLNHDILEIGAVWVLPFDYLLPYVNEQTIGPMFEALPPQTKRTFLSQARTRLAEFDELIAFVEECEEDTTPLMTMRAWLFQQPFNVDPSLPVPSTADTEVLSDASIFARILPHVRPGGVDRMLEKLPERFRTFLPRFLAGLRPGLDVVLATARAQGQSEKPWQVLMEWEASQTKLQNGTE